VAAKRQKASYNGNRIISAWAWRHEKRNIAQKTSNYRGMKRPRGDEQWAAAVAWLAWQPIS